MARKGENIFKRKDGRWEARYIKGYKAGKAVYGYVYGKSYTEAKEKKSAAIVALSLLSEQSMDITPVQPMLGDVAAKWLDGLRSVRKKSTVVKYSNQLESHILPRFGNVGINAITNEDIIGFSHMLLTEKDLSPKTVADILSRMKSIRRFALIHGYEVLFIPECVSIPQGTEEIRVFSFKEEETLIHYLREHFDLTSLGILVCLFTGLRVGELCALTWNEISLDEREIHVRRTMQRLQDIDGSHKGKTYIEIDEPKSRASIRTVPIPDIIMDDLRSKYTKDAYLLTGHMKFFVEPRTMENRFKSILDDCGIENATMHTCRHSYATRCVEAGFDIKSLSEMLGHANVSITLNRYVHPTMQLKHTNARKLDQLFAVK